MKLLSSITICYWRVIVILSIVSISIINTFGWTPGSTANPGFTDFTVDQSSRSDVLSFYHHIFLSSENTDHLINWSGNHDTCNIGLTSDAYVKAIQRRVNYYRAMAGVQANISMNTSSLSLEGDISAYNPAPGTTKTQAAQSAALLLSKSNILTHFPKVESNNCFTAAAGNGSNFGNIAIGINGTTAIDFYMKEDQYNLDAGHRRWMLFDRSSNFATGDVPDFNSHAVANCLYIQQSSSELTTVEPKFVPWPNQFNPWVNATPFWSLSYRGADFRNAKVSVTRNGQPVNLTIVSRALGYGNNSIVWQVLDFPQVLDDVTYNVSVTDISGGGPSSHHYFITFFDPNRIPDKPFITGVSNPRFPSELYTFTSTQGVDDYRLDIGRLENATFVEGAEDTTADKVINGPDTGYLLRQTANFLVGKKGFRLAFSSLARNEQWFMLDRIILPGKSSSISFQLRRGFMNGSYVQAPPDPPINIPATVIAVEYSTDDVLWQTLPNSTFEGKSGGYIVDKSFVLRTIPIPSHLENLPLRFRFIYKKQGLSEYQTSQSDDVGAFVDSISFAGCRTVATRKQTTLPKSANQFHFNEATTGEPLRNASYILFLQPRFGNSYLSSGNSLIVNGNDGGITPNKPPTLNAIVNPKAINEDSGQQTITLSGISAGSGESQALTITASSSNTALIPNPAIDFNAATSVASVRYTPVNNSFGSATISVTMNDGQSANNTITRTFTVVVTTIDDAPDASAIPNQQLDEDTSINVPVTITDIDSSVTSASLRATSSNATLLPASAFAYSGTGASRILRITPAANRNGTATVSLTVTNLGKSVIKTFLVTVNPVNDAPFITPIPVLAPILEDAKPFTRSIAGISTGLFETQTLTITATSSNPEILPHPTVDHVAGSTTATITYAPNANANGSVVIRLSLNDGSTTNPIRVYELPLTITPVDDAPDSLPIPNQQLDEDTSIDVPITITDIDSLVTSATLRATSNNATLLPASAFIFSGTGANRTLRITSAANRNGSATVSLTVTNLGKSVIKTFLVTVNPVNDAPFITPIPVLAPILEDAKPFTRSIAGISPGLFETQTLTINATSSNTDIIPHPTVTHVAGSTTATMTYAPAANANGSVVIRLSLNDGSAINHLRTYELPLTITPVDDVPTISLIAPILAIVNSAIPVISYSIEDIDNDASTLVVRAVSSNQNLLPSARIALGGNGTARTLTLTPQPNIVGSTNVTITVTSGKLTTTRIFAVTTRQATP